MDDLSPFDRARRSFLVRALATGLLAAVPGLSHGTSVREISGQVWVDGELAKAGMSIAPGAQVETGIGARFTFAIGKDAFLMRERSRVHFGSRDNIIVHSARLLTGALLAVFGGGAHTIASAHMTAGVRGTGIYIETGSDETYFCLCYGEGDARLAGAPDEPLALGPDMHNAHRFLADASSADAGIVRVGLENHTDAELYLLEKLVGRTPPFALGSYDYSAGPSSDGGS